MKVNCKRDLTTFPTEREGQQCFYQGLFALQRSPKHWYFVDKRFCKAATCETHSKEESNKMPVAAPEL